MHLAQLRLAARPGHLDLLERALEPFHMRVIVDELAADDCRHLIDAIGEEKATIEDRHLPLVFRHIASIHIDDAAHQFFPHGLEAV
jgi:hypothetical protein